MPSQQELTPVLSFSLLTNWRFTRGVKEQTKAFLDGFNEVVPLEWLRYFDEKELEVRKVEQGGLEQGPPRLFSKKKKQKKKSAQLLRRICRMRFHGLKPLLSGLILLPFSHSFFAMKFTSTQ